MFAFCFSGSYLCSVSFVLFLFPFCLDIFLARGEIIFRLLSAVPTVVAGLFLLLDFIPWAALHKRETFCISVQGW